MTIAALRVPREAPVPSPHAWFPARLGLAAGWSGNNVNVAYYNGHTYVGFCDGDGNARVASYSHSTKTWTLSPAIVTGLIIDRHCTPSVLVRSSDHKIVIAVSSHDGPSLYIAISTNAEDVSAWGTATDIDGSLGGSEYTYINLFQLSGESGKIHLFYRDYNTGTATGSLAHATSTDGGATWSAQTVLYTAATGKVPYWAIGSDDTSRIDIFTSDGNAPSGDVASMYHFYYSGGSWFKSDGTAITAGTPFGPTNLTKIYDGATNGHVRAPYSVIGGSTPVGVWASYNVAGSGSNSTYWYAVYTGGAWVVNEIADTGAVPDPAFQEGGLAIDQTDHARVFVSRKSSGFWQMFKYETPDNGATWTNTQLSFDTGVTGDVLNLRPETPRDANAALTVVWTFGPDYGPIGSGTEPPATQIRAYPLGETI